MNWCDKCNWEIERGNCTQCCQVRGLDAQRKATKTMSTKEHDNLIDINEDPLEALKYVKRFLKHKEVDMEYIDSVIKKAEKLQNV